MESIQQILAVLFVLGSLCGTLFWLRGKGVARFSGAGFRRPSGRRMQPLERLPLTPQHSLHLVRVGGRVLLIGVSPGGCSVLNGAEWEIPAGDGTVTK
jgi:flagellar biogenesis protein FliO